MLGATSLDLSSIVTLDPQRFATCGVATRGSALRTLGIRFALYAPRSAHGQGTSSPLGYGQGVVTRDCSSRSFCPLRAENRHLIRIGLRHHSLLRGLGCGQRYAGSFSSLSRQLSDLGGAYLGNASICGVGCPRQCRYGRITATLQSAD